MSEENGYWSYLATGIIFYSFGLKWCYDYAKLYYVPPKSRQGRHDSPEHRGPLSQMKHGVSRMLNEHPIEGMLKLVATACGLLGILFTRTKALDSQLVSPYVINATIYLFFASSGLTDVLHFYFPLYVSEGLAKTALAQSFFVEGLFMWTEKYTNSFATSSSTLSFIVWLSCISVALELVWPEMKLLSASLTLLHGTWIAHMIRMNGMEMISQENVALIFSWHIAGASLMTLLVVSLTKAYLPREPPPPPRVPIYDFVNEMEIRNA
ncbi:hypothetical protein TKK_0001855 [Trichogramma kaykai]|uniref:Uncharacterized protein n=1 Tax=Trichogramma kaykai TaxID=54128 RepID=A0ABD2XFL3_9HYME